jgi:hypothetical protein
MRQAIANASLNASSISRPSDQLLVPGWLQSLATRNDNGMLPTQDPISAITAPVVKNRGSAPIRWLRVELSSGRRFEISPVETYFENERYPRLAVAIEEVLAFADARSWPGGPSVEWVMPTELQVLLGHSIQSSTWLRDSDAEPPKSYEARLSNGAVMRVRHSQASPMALALTVLSAAHGASSNC